MDKPTLEEAAAVLAAVAVFHRKLHPRKPRLTRDLPALLAELAGAIERVSGVVEAVAGEVDAVVLVRDGRLTIEGAAREEVDG